mmetsp:Transcript_59878/g.147136  ORF Transcript_59878/g.147136 Transcript_59878/m.147136 type:complete len:252 (+) Transcript_59878:2496-3251(+)|eukprot:CAMPEP_0113507574 /NCGR_PEP_ID=MMETSP0014_2-20120614/36543_1 /TAXON_ID=2857 /ORGANISM="Nitzschia sp." /LENGTH=251 /DNA_ID=CAMNT_0000403203 /DNA_START=308 /DNA_END=1063 /DNA_ORIENTATION=+ /assembly_acc=CAM_ASM_000159
MKTIAALSLALGAVAPVAAFTNTASTSSRPAPVTALQESKADLEALAKDLNPILGFWDPLDLVDAGFWGFDQERTIGWLRQSEIKHGRVAMAAFVGYCVQSNFVFPWSLTFGGMPHPSTDLSPPEQWDALPLASKAQIIAFVGFLEFFSELYENGLPHYTKGGKPGAFPPLKDNVPHFVPFNLYDPFNLSKNRSEEAKARGLKAEINNGRLAQLGIFGFLCEQTIPGSVPVLTGIVKPYSGDMIGGLDFTL